MAEQEKKNTVVQDVINTAEPVHKVNNIILRTLSSRIIYLLMAFAIYLYMAGHNGPGGGFIAGLMMSGGMVLMYLTFGSRFVKTTLTLDFKYMIGIGLIFAVGCGLGGVFFGYPFLTHTFGHFVLPFLGDVELATAMIFDFGVFLVVVGSTMTTILTIGENKN